jgi:pimeloyl-ACP methyl ester carboxylesterase
MQREDKLQKYGLRRKNCPAFRSFAHMKQTLVVNGRRIAYVSQVSSGSKALPLVLLHGLCEDADIWAPMLPLLENIPLIRVDLPGFGASDLPLTASMEAYADAVCAVLNELGVPRAVVVGHSMGGYTALAFAEHYPERLAGLGLFHAHPFADTPDRVEARHRSIALLKEGKRDLYVKNMFAGLFAPAFAAAHPEKVEWVIKHQGCRQSAEGIAVALEGMMARPDRTATLGQCPHPVLWLLGAMDVLVPTAPVLDAAAGCPVSMVHLLPGVGHMGMLEAPAECAGILQAFYAYCAGR